MYRFRIILFLLIICCTCQASVKPFTGNSKRGFIENKGQVIDQNNKPNPAVLYLLNTPGMNVQLRRGGFSYDLYGISNIEQRISNIEVSRSAACVTRHASRVTKTEPDSTLTNYKFHRIDFDLIGSNPQCEIITSGPSEDFRNYYTTGTPVEGVTFVHSYQTVTYKNIYPGIDLEFFTAPESGVKYNFVVHPEGKLSSIRMKITDPEIVITSSGSLKIINTIGTIEEEIPQSFCQSGQSKVDVNVRFVKTGEDIYGFAVDQALPEHSTLVIDPYPTRMWGTYYGGSDFDGFMDIKFGMDRNIYLCGETSSADNIATTGAFQTTLKGGQDGLIASFTTAGERNWATYFGGAGDDYLSSISLDENNNLFFAGNTDSPTNIASPGAYQTNLSGFYNACFGKFNSTGQRIWSSYYGGSVAELGTGIFADQNGYIYLCGIAYSPDNIATPGAHQPTSGGGEDSFLVKFSTDGNRIWGTYYGGSCRDKALSVIGDQSGVVFLTGETTSPDNISTPGSHQPLLGNPPCIYTISDGYLVRFSSDGVRQWGTYYGGASLDHMQSIAISADENVYICGSTTSQDNISTPGSFQPGWVGLPDHANLFLVKFNYAGQRSWATYYGGTYGEGNDSDVMVDDSLNVFIASDTHSSDNISTPNSYQPALPANGIYSVIAFLVKFNPQGERQWGTYYGDTITTLIRGLTYDGDTIYACGGTSDLNRIASAGAFQTTLGGSSDGMIVKFADCYNPDSAGMISGPDTVCSGVPVVFSVPAIPFAQNYLWEFPAGATIVIGQNTNSVTVIFGTGTIPGFIVVRGENTCGPGSPNSKWLNVNPSPIPVISGDNEICQDNMVIYQTDPGNMLYLWDVSVGGSILTGGTLTDDFAGVSWSVPGPQWITIQYTDTNGCVAIDPAIFNVNVASQNPVSVTVSASENNICAGASVTFTAIPVNAGSNPIYQWQVNGINAGTNQSTYNYLPADNDIVQCSLFSNLTCTLNNPATSNAVTMVVNQVLPVSVTISPGANPVCAGTNVIFTANPVNVGSSPAYQWKVNANNASNGNNTWFTYTPVNGDVITCEVSSSELCISGNPALSNPVTMVVHANLPAGIIIAASANPFCSGSAVTFTATAVNGGSTPLYQWKVNASNASNGNNAVFTYNPVDNDQVQCILTSDLTCVTGNPAVSGMIIMTGLPAPTVTFLNCFDAVTTINAQPFKLKGGLPLGGTYSGPGVNSTTSMFSPLLAGTGTKSITYSYTNASLCSDSKSQTIIVTPTPMFTCGNTLADIRDNRTYPTVQIGAQCWMQANLEFGVEIPEFNPQTDNCLVEKYVHNSTFVNQYSIFYQWDELMRYNATPGSQGLCPPGWHVPTENEWNTLFNFYQGYALAGKPLQYNMISGFMALPGGIFYQNSSWSFLDFATIFWSSTSSGQYRAI
ncbi:MAG: FISUMP domain-containing protein, partial [Bacteroidales bacterium]|nr:FISUMP domain-containing protein [Bacteroidales bacterium]